MKTVLSLSTLLVLILGVNEASARQCRAYLHDEFDRVIGQFTNSRGCEEARAECLREGRYRAPRGYCTDDRGNGPFPVNPGYGPGYGRCEVDLYVRNGFVRSFSERRCRAAFIQCDDYARTYYPGAWRRGQTQCLER